MSFEKQQIILLAELLCNLWHYESKIWNMNTGLPLHRFKNIACWYLPVIAFFKPYHFRLNPVLRVIPILIPIRPGIISASLTFINYLQILDEISGLAFYPKDSGIFSIQDEKGWLFKIRLKNPLQIERWKFSNGAELMKTFPG